MSEDIWSWIFDDAGALLKISTNEDLTLTSNVCPAVSKLSKLVQCKTCLNVEERVWSTLFQIGKV